MLLNSAPTTPHGPTPHATTAQIDGFVEELIAIRTEMLGGAGAAPASLSAIHPDRRSSACNLIHYLTLRRHDLRSLQVGLATLGLSSLGRAEAHVLASLDAVIGALHALKGQQWTRSDGSGPDFEAGDHLLAEQTEQLLGRPSHGRGVRIMVTMPSEAADDYSLVHDLVQQGMNCMRINCAHDDAARWMRMIDHLRRAETTVGVSCQILMDLGGPKLRTGPVEPGPAVAKIRPKRDLLGRVTAPARVWLTDRDAPQPPPSVADACLPVAWSWLQRLQVGDRVTFQDARHARRRLQIADATGAGSWAESMKTAYFVPGMKLRWEGKGDGNGERESTIGDLPPLEPAIRLAQGDTLTLTKGLVPGRPASVDRSGQVLTPASIGCSLPQVFDDVRAGEPIWFDDGRIGGLIDRVDTNHLSVRITQAPVTGGLLRSDKGINLPESNLRVPALTPKDIDDLAFVVEHADMVALSFASSADDVELLQEHMTRLGNRQPAIVLKIETRRGFEQLPDMLMAAMKMPCAGVMIARGDLAVECGFERLAEVQEEILWISEAAHVPVIWATQVLETLAKHGIASRAEITDAAMGHRAECVMLNKGPHIVTAVRMLDDILKRMQAHHAKKSSMLRELRVAHALPTDGASYAP